MARGILLDGHTYALNNSSTGRPIPVHAWYDRNGPKVPEFRPGDGYNHRRRRYLEGDKSKPLINLAVWHWTGGEGNPDVMAETLRKRKLGIEFAIDRVGDVWQFCDPGEVDTADAGKLNFRSLGVEIVCYGFRPMVMLVPKLGRDRLIYEATTHGRTVNTAKFYPVQLQTACALAEVFSRVLPIPWEVCTWETVLPGIKDFKGHIGHYQCDLDKRDPGPWFMEQLQLHMERIVESGETTNPSRVGALPPTDTLFPDRLK